MENYNLVYNYFETPNDFGDGSMLMLLGILIFLIYSIVKKQGTYKIVFLSFSFLFMSIWNIMVHGGQYENYKTIENLYSKHMYKTIEGVVSNYSPMKIEGHGSRETFFVDSIFFSYSDYIGMEGYNNSCVKGGMICNEGQKVKIEFINKMTFLTGQESNKYIGNVLGNQIIKLYLKK